LAITLSLHNQSTVTTNIGKNRNLQGIKYRGKNSWAQIDGQVAPTVLLPLLAAPAQIRGHKLEIG
jgi:hypothetical protein